MNKKPTKPKVLIISGPAGVGKDTVMKKLKKFNLPLRRIITTTSRPKRKNEKQGRPYYFVSAKKFQQMIAEGKFIEYAKVFDNWKGVTKAELEKVVRSDKGVLLQIDWQGAKTIKKLYPQTVVIVITPPSIQTLDKRLINRGDKQTHELTSRIKKNKFWRKDYASFDYFVSNPENRPEIAAKQISKIIKSYL